MDRRTEQDISRLKAEIAGLRLAASLQPAASGQGCWWTPAIVTETGSALPENTAGRIYFSAPVATERS